MNYIYKHTDMEYRITSDTHFWHKMLIDIWLRKEWCDKKIFNRLMSIPKDDMLIHLWDILIWKDSELHDKYIKPLKCKKILIMWNHDRKSAQRYMNHWRDFACTRHVMYLDRHKVLLSHRPEDNLPKWRVNLHWHRHEKVNPPYSDNHYMYSPELENYIPKKLVNCFTHYTDTVSWLSNET